MSGQSTGSRTRYSLLSLEELSEPKYYFDDSFPPILSLQAACRACVEGVWFQRAVAVAVLLNTAVLSLDHYPSTPDFQFGQVMYISCLLKLSFPC